MTYNQVDHIWIDRRWHSSIVIVESCRRADCDTDDCRVVTKVRDIFGVSKQAAQKFDVERFNLRKISDLEGR